MLKVKNISKSLGSFKLENINLNLEEGFIMGIVGSNGSGKTTLMKLIMGLLDADEGSIKIFDKDIKNYPIDIKNDIGFVYDSLDFYPNLKIKDFKKIMELMYKNFNKNKFNNYLDKFSLSEKLTIKYLSKGESVKLILANTFYCDYENNSRNFIKSMPTSKEDIVYSKYIMGAAIILIITVLCTIINQIFSVFLLREVVLDDIYFGVNSFLIIISIILPLYFRFGYHKVRGLCGFISVWILIFCIATLSMISDKVFHSSKSDSVIVYVTSGPFAKVIINFIENATTKYLNLNTMTFITIIIFIISMYASLKIIKSKKSNY